MDSSLADYTLYFIYFLAAALLILVLEPLLRNIKLRKKTYKNSAAFLLLVISFSANAQDAKKDIITGNKSYNQSIFSDAIKAYQKALNKSSTNDVAQYNLGNALYKDDKAEEAIKSYDAVIARNKDSGILAKTYYNKGVAHQKLKQNPEAIDSYKKALKLDPSDEQARQNLQRLLQEMKQQQQQNKENKDKKKEEKKDKKGREKRAERRKRR